MQPSESDLHELEGMVEIVNAPAGTRLLSEGQPVDFVASVQRGEIELYRLAGRHRVVFEIVRQGDLFGVPPFLSAEPAAYTARAVTPTTLLLIETSDLERLLVSRPAVARAFIWALVRRMERMQHRLAELVSPGLRSRVAALLLDETEGDHRLIRLPQSTLAELLGASRPRVNGILKEFERDGLVRLTYRRIEVLDRKRLNRIAA
jgi:CRP/FNR family transcriptional regulator, cAMP and macrophage regulator